MKATQYDAFFVNVTSMAITVALAFRLIAKFNVYAHKRDDKHPDTLQPRSWMKKKDLQVTSNIELTNTDNEETKSRLR